MSDNNLLQVTPWVLAHDVAAIVRYFAEILTSQVRVNAGDYAYLDRGCVAVRIGKMSEEAEESVKIGQRAWLFYIDVRDIDALVDEVRPGLLAAGMPRGEGPVDQPWGKREFWAPVPEGGFIVFGQEIVCTPAV